MKLKRFIQLWVWWICHWIRGERIQYVYLSMKDPRLFSDVNSYFHDFEHFEE